MIPHAAQLREALEFYARHEHWMALSDEADSLEQLFIAMKGDGKQHGWLVAQQALSLPSPSAWRDIGEAPECQRVLVYIPIEHHRQVIGWKTQLGIWLDEHMQPMPFPPTHFQPLPAPPETP